MIGEIRLTLEASQSMKTRPRRNLGELPNRHNGGPRKTTRNLILSPTQTNLHVPAQEVSADEDVLVHQRIVQNQTKAKKRRAVIDKVVAGQAKIRASQLGKRAKSFKDGRFRLTVKIVRKPERSWLASRNAKRAMKFQRTDY
uniref:Uncharacterized protein n=1 Tax=Trichogramma kaykai TaxID=54128 RepID=A0ABD2WPV5_9HYME